MRIKKKHSGKLFAAGVLMLGLMSFGGMNKAYAKEEAVHEATVDTFEELKAAFLDSDIDTIYVAADIMVPCGNKDFTSDYKSASAALVADRDLVIEGLNGKSYTLTRFVANEEDGVDKCRSMIEVYGNGTYDGIQVSIKNLVLDGGANWGTTTISQRTIRDSGRWPSNTGYAGRAIIDVANKGTINLESGAILRNAQTSVNSQTRQAVSNVSGSSCYGAGIRIEYSNTNGGGTANLKMGAVIEDCSSANWGGAIGAYNYGRLNIYGGTIRRCSSQIGAAICCTYRANTSSATASIMKMYGGTIEDCVSSDRGVINIDGSNELPSEFFGGIIKNCDGYAINVSERATKLNIADYDGDNIQISNVKKGNFESGAYTAACGIEYADISSISFIDAFILLFMDKEQVLGNISIEKETACGASFPADPVKEGYRFNSWISRDGESIDADTIITKNQILTADWTNLHEHGDIQYSVDEGSVTASCNGTVYPKNCELKKVSVQFEDVSDVIFNPGQNACANLSYLPSNQAWKELTGDTSETLVKYEEMSEAGEWVDMGDDLPTDVGTYRAYAMIGKNKIYSKVYKINSKPITSIDFTEPAVDVGKKISDYTKVEIDENEPFTATIMWYDWDGKLCQSQDVFDFNYEYTASITLEAKDNYCFDPSLNIDEAWTVESQTEFDAVIKKAYKMRKAKIFSVETIDEYTLDSVEIDYEAIMLGLVPSEFKAQVEMVDGDGDIFTGTKNLLLCWYFAGAVTEDGIDQEKYNNEPNEKNVFEWDLCLYTDSYEIMLDSTTGYTVVTNGTHKHTYSDSDARLKEHKCMECGVAGKHNFAEGSCVCCGLNQECYENGHLDETVITKATTSENGLLKEACELGDMETKSIIYYPKTVSLSATSYVYSGKPNKPTVTVIDAAGKTIDKENYDVTYSKNTAVGAGEAVITFKGNYEGAITKTFKIVPPATKLASIANANDGITVKWSKVSSSAGYKVYRSVNKKAYTLVKTITKNSTVSFTDKTATTNGAQYQYKVIAYKTVGGKAYNSSYSAVKSIYRLTHPIIKSLTNSAAGELTVKWDKNAKASGYEVKLVVGTKTKTVKVAGAKKLTSKIKKLTKGKTYKVYVRSYKTVGKTTCYSVWSAVKSVKITK